MIHSVVLDRESGGVNSKGEFYTVVYKVITDKFDSPSLMIDYAESRSTSYGWRLPYYGDAYYPGGIKSNTVLVPVNKEVAQYNDIPERESDNSSVGGTSSFFYYADLIEYEGCRYSFVDNITIERATDIAFKGNNKVVPYTDEDRYHQWTYTVSYNSETRPIVAIGGSASISGTESDWVLDYAYDVSITPVFYDVYSDQHYYTKKDGKEYLGTDLSRPIGFLRNTAGESMYITRKIYNAILSFSYYTKTVSPNRVLMSSTVNSKQMKIAGIDIDKLSAKLQKFDIEKVDYNNGRGYCYKINCSIELQVQKPVLYTELLSKGTKALMPYKDKEGNTVYKLRTIQYATDPSIYNKPDNPDYCLVDPNRNLGCFKPSDHSLDITDEMPLTTTGELVVAPPGTPFSTIDAMTARVKAYETVIADWSILKMPRKGLEPNIRRGYNRYEFT